MPEFLITDKETKKQYRVTGPDAAGAREALRKKLSASQNNEGGVLSKLGRAADDMARLFATGATVGQADRLASGKYGGYNIASMAGDIQRFKEENGRMPSPAEIQQMTRGGIRQRTEELNAAAAPERAKTQAARDRAGSAGLVSEVAGSFAPFGAVSKVFSTPTAMRMLPQSMNRGLTGVLSRAAISSPIGAAYGAADAAGYDRDVKTGALIGAVAGPAGSLVADTAQGVGKMWTAMTKPKPPVQSYEALKAKGGQLLDQADASGAVIAKPGLSELTKRVRAKLVDRGYDPDNHPGLKAFLRTLGNYNKTGAATFKGMRQLRRKLNAGYRTNMPDNNDLLRIVRQEYDTFLDEALSDPKRGWAFSPPGSKAYESMKQGNELYQRAKKIEKVRKLFNRAELNAASSGTGGNIENSIKQQMKRILTTDGWDRGFKPDELAAVKDLVNSPLEKDLMRQLGRFSPQGNALGMWLGGATAAYNPHVGVPLMAGGYASKKVADALTRGEARGLERLIAGGGKRALVDRTPSALELLTRSKRDKLVDALLLGSVLHGTEQ